MTWHLIGECEQGIHYIKWIPISQTPICERRHRRNTSQQIDKNLSHLNTPQIRKEREDRIKQSLAKISNPNPLLKTFVGGGEQKIDVHYNNRTYGLWFQSGNQKNGAVHISIKHLIDGGTAFCGGFTLEELNNGLNDIQSPYLFEINRDKMKIEWTDSSGINWRLIAFRSQVGKRWIINSIYRILPQNDPTPQRVAQMYPKRSNKPNDSRRKK